MKYAIIQLQGKQHKVEVGQVLTVDLMDNQVGDTITITDVLLTNDGKKIQIGTPLVKGAQVTLKVVEHGQGDKLRVMRFTSKSRHRRTIGHRRQLTNLEVVSV
ncbi:50S ribosomal protein L21 [Microgenomates group bacterium]|nr:50S ribosomal protein L21 [Microgenomates group bacterium]